MHPFLDVSKLSDEQIIEKLGKAYTFMNMQKELGHNPSVFSIQEVISSLEGERQRRMQSIMDNEYLKKNPNELKSIDLGKLEE